MAKLRSAVTLSRSTRDTTIPRTAPTRLDEIISGIVPARYCIVHKADIPKYRVHAVASYVRFHSRHNRLKGDRRRQGRNLRRWKRFRHRRIGMLSRALSSATVMLLIGCFAPGPAPAQAQNLEAGKSPSQIF